MRPGLLVMTTILAAAATTGQAWAGAAEICTNAGYRVGSAAFDLCLARVTPDDPLAELDAALDSEEAVSAPASDPLDLFEAPISLRGERGKVDLAPITPPRRDDKLPPSTQPVGFDHLPGAGAGNGAAPPPPTSQLPPSTPVQPPPSAPGGGMTTPTAPTSPTAPTAPNAPSFSPFSFTMPSWNWGN